MKKLLYALMLVFLALSLRAQSIEDQYVTVYNNIQEADNLAVAQPGQALAKYKEAQSSLEQFQRVNPNWNPEIVKFRLDYVRAQIADLSPKVPVMQPKPAARTQTPTATRPQSPAPAAGPPAPAPTTAATAPEASIPKSSEAPVQRDETAALNALKQQLTQLQSDNQTLQAKLKEAFALKPAEADPRELARADQRIAALQKENELLKATLDEHNRTATKPAPGPSPELARLQKELADANAKLDIQARQAASLAQERQALQQKLEGMSSAKYNTANVDRAQKALDETTRQLKDQQNALHAVTTERDALQSKLAALTAEAQKAGALRAENELLKNQLAEAHRARPSSGKDSSELNQLRAQLAVLQSDREMLSLEKTALQNQLKRVLAGKYKAQAPQASAAPDTRRLQQLQQDRDELRAKLDAAEKQLTSRKTAGSSAQVQDLEDQLKTLRLRLEVLEMHKVPYSEEELNLMKQPNISLQDPNAGKLSVQELPPGTAAMVAEAQRYFLNHQLDKAEATYQQVLKKDHKNAPALANLAAIQLERGNLEEADKNIQQALASSPEDPFTVSLLGHLRFKQKRYDDAIEALGRAARLDPQSAPVQMLLGLSLSEKGLRGPAETALRKAIQLQPDYGDAHANLAVVYMTQQPPMLQLARWHYQKALASGAAANPDLEKMLQAKESAAR
jgi:Flp pilus assembly protein TadD